MNSLCRSAAIGLAVLMLAMVAAPVLAAPGGNSGASAACENGGYVNLTDTSGNAFRNEGACVRYAAHGGVLVPVATGPFSVSYSAAGSGTFSAVLTGTGLQPSSIVRFSFVWPARSVSIEYAIDATGNTTLTHGELCVDENGANMTSLTATGTPAGGVETAYSLALPPPSICP